MQEIKKTSFAKSIRTLTLGARKSLCIHPDVRKLTSDTAMTDKCLDLIQSTKTKAPGCPYNKRTTQVHFRHHALAQVQDIEELHDLGQQIKSTRESLGIHIKGSIVILDEAHNIADAVNNTYSVTEDGGKENCLKFMLLNPALHFADIVAEAKSVSQVLHSLLLGVDRERIDLFSCGHIIPPANLTA
ncbi:hypothetical protein DYB37_013607, partial [Aphanomyces astaci]